MGKPTASVEAESARKRGASRHLHRCFKCGKTLSTRERKRVDQHAKSCSGGRRVLRQCSQSPPSPKRRSRRTSTDLTLAIKTPAAFSWTTCPICKCYVPFENRRELHFQTHFNPNRAVRPTPAETIADKATMESPARQFYRLTQPVSRIDNVRLNSVEERLSFNLTEEGIQMARSGNLMALMDIIIRDIIEKHQGNPHARLRLIFDSESLDYAFSGMFQKADDFSVYSFLDQLERVINSKQAVNTDEKITLYVQSIAEPISGSGKSVLRRKDYVNAMHFLKMRKSVFYIDNTDHSCFFLAIAAGLQFRENDPKRVNKAWFRAPHCSTQLRDVAHHLMNLVNHPSTDPVTPALFSAMQASLNDSYSIQMIIFDSDDSESICFYGEPNREERNKLYLTYTENHYSYVKDRKTYLGGFAICEFCYKTYKTYHNCSLKCDRCRSTNCYRQRQTQDACANQNASVQCPKCGRMYYTPECLNEHLAQNVCDNVKKCSKCDRIHSSTQQHFCGMMKCYNCKEWVAIPHLCHTVPPADKNKDKFIFIVYDIETLVDTVSGFHVGYLVCSARVCELCCDDERDCAAAECSQCIKRFQTFYGLDCLQNFCSYILQPFNHGAVLLSHNGSGFDNYFVIDEIMKSGSLPKVITRGHRFLRVDLGRSVTMIDTCQFFFCKLATLSGIFSIPEEKGYFPFKFATTENLNMIFESYPEPEMYGYSHMSSSERNKFLDWYTTKRHTTFNFRSEAIHYCLLDVLLLMKASMRFRRLVLDEYGVDPWLNSMSLSHLASIIYRKCFLPNADLLGIMPTTGYTDMYRGQASLLGIKYLEWIKHESGTDIIHGGDHLEQRLLGRFPCDGIVLKDSNAPITPENVSRVYDIRGCFYHNHREHCSINQRFGTASTVFRPEDLEKPHPLRKNLSYRDIIDNDNQRVGWFTSRGVNVSIIYECEINAMMKENIRFQKFFMNDKIWKKYAMPIGPREALFGGRVTVGRLLCELTEADIDDGYRILYDDYVSLYPAVMRSEQFPIGHPQIIKYPNLPESINLDNIDNYFGLVKAKVLPSQSILHGVLPHKLNGKLLFSLCSSCSVEFPDRQLTADDFDLMGNVRCEHNIEDRSFWGVFCTVEMKLALQMGYTVLAISEIWHYDRGDLFSGYVNGMVAMKVENSGYPEYCVNPSEKLAYVQQMALDGIILNPSNIRKCNGKRQIGKLLANSLWGKISQGIDRTNTKFISKPSELSAILRDPTIEITDCMFMRQGSSLCISYKENIDVERQMALYNPTVGAFVTAYGRIRLYKLMHAAGSNFIYGDTDSVIYLTKPGLFIAEHGSKIGDVASEINWPDDYIVRFVCGGPKTYSYTTRSGKTSIKAKGLSLKCRVGEKVEFEHIKAIVLDQCEEIGPMFYEMLDEPLRTRLMVMHAERFVDQADHSKSFLLLPHQRITKDKRTLKLENKEMIKILQFSGADKRRVLKHWSLKTVEFGYKS